MKKNENQKIFKSFSRNLNNFLKGEGIFPIDKGVHTTGVNISPDGGKTWEDYTSLVQALDKYYKILTREELETSIAESFKVGAPVESGYYSEDNEPILIRKRVRYFNVYELNDRLQLALNRWEQTGPKSKK